MFELSEAATVPPAEVLTLTVVLSMGERAAWSGLVRALRAGDSEAAKIATEERLAWIGGIGVLLEPYGITPRYLTHTSEPVML